MRLILTRHGLTEDNIAGIIQGHLPGKLTAEGIEQARQLGMYLANEKLDAIYSSDLTRAADTTKEIISFHKDTPLIFTNSLRERYLGSLEGKKREDLLGDIINLEPEDGESIAEACKRATDFLQEIRVKHLNETVLFVTHGFFSKCIFAAISRQTPEAVKTMKHFGNTSVSIFDIDAKGNHEVISLNSMKHLEPTSDR